jgi:hypothetical protein
LRCAVRSPARPRVDLHGVVEPVSSHQKCDVASEFKPYDPC